MPGLGSIAPQGYYPVVAVGFQTAESVLTVAKSSPDTKLSIIDSTIAMPEDKRRELAAGHPLGRFGQPGGHLAR